MKGLSFSYVARNLVARKFTTLLTATGMALVIFVFATVLMMAEGLRHTMAGTGSYNNAVIFRQGAQTEVQSTVERNAAAILGSKPGVSTAADGSPLQSDEVLVLVNLRKKSTGALANVVVRGTTAHGLAMRPQVQIVRGRLFRPGSDEVVIGAGIARGHQGTAIGDTLHFGMRDWTVVGVFDSGNSGFDSEVWGDSEQMMQAFRRTAFSSVIVSLRDSESFERFAAAVKADQRLNVDVKRESVFYAEQSEQLATFISVLGKTITAIFSIGAIIGAMITMYASVANRTREIGTLRALGFRRGNIVAAFLQEAILLGLLSGVVGLFAASFMQLLHIATTNMQTFSEVVFTLILTPGICVQVLLFSVFMGVVGGALPAISASRLQIVDALRAT